MPPDTAEERHERTQWVELRISFGGDGSHKHEDNGLLLVNLCLESHFLSPSVLWMLVVDKVARLTPEKVFISLLNSILALGCRILLVSALARELIEGSVHFRSHQRIGYK